MKENQNRILFLISFFTLMVALTWTYISIFKITKGKKIEKPIISSKEIKIIDPTLDEKVLEEIEKRIPEE